MSQTIFIAGATGQQGSALIDALLSPSSSRVTVHGLTRDQSSPSAKSLLAKRPNVKLFTGSFDDIQSITTAATGCTSAFLNVTPVFTDPTGEARHARNLIQACSNIPSIKRIVWSSSSAMHNPDLDDVFNNYIPNHPNDFMSHYMTSKKACEDAVINSNFDDGWTILRGTMFYTNFVKPFTTFMYPDLESKQTITTAFREDYEMNLVDPLDIGAVAAQMLTSTPEEWAKTWKGKFVPLASETLTLAQVIDKMNESLRRQGSSKQIKLIHIGQRDAEERAKNGDMIVASQLFSNRYIRGDLTDEVRSFGIDVDRLVRAGEFYDREGRRVLETVGGA